jgi:acyl-[acyl-carrier-protein] desaturase
MGIAPREQFGTPEQIEVLSAMEAFVLNETELHKSRRNLWFPNDHLPADATLGEEWEAQIRDMRRLAAELPDTVRVALALNLLTEEGLPHFHRLIAVHFGGHSAWTAWNNLWTAEEDRHGCALRDYVRDARLFDMGALERFQYRYIEAGFEPEWERDPYRLLAYTSLQEKATQVSHANTSRLAASHEPVLQRVLAHLAGDELRHFYFYRNVFGEVLRHDTSRALGALLKVTLNFAMPGHTIDGFEAMSEVVRRSNVFGPRHYQKIVEELLAHWSIGTLTGLSAEGAQAQDKLMKFPKRLERMADLVEARTAPREFSFGFTFNRSITV